MPRAIPAPLWEAYRQTAYVVRPQGRGGARLELRVGQRNPDFERLARQAAPGARQWAMLTAYNPGSRPRPARDNRNAHRRLRRALEKVSAQVWPGHGRGDDRQWTPEPMWLALGVSRDEALELGRRFEQNAIIQGELGGPARLLACP